MKIIPTIITIFLSGKNLLIKRNTIIEREKLASVRPKLRFPKILKKKLAETAVIKLVSKSSLKTIIRVAKRAKFKGKSITCSKQSRAAAKTGKIFFIYRLIRKQLINLPVKEMAPRPPFEKVPFRPF